MIEDSKVRGKRIAKNSTSAAKFCKNWLMVEGGRDLKAVGTFLDLYTSTGFENERHLSRSRLTLRF